MVRILSTLLVRCLFLVVASFHFQATAQDSDSSQDAPVSADIERIEQIDVIGERTFISIRFQIREAEENLYAIFNELNSSDEFDINCRTIKQTRSYIPVRQCEPRFLTRARQTNSTMALAGMREGLLSIDDQGQGLNQFAFESGITSLQDDRELSEQQESNFEALSEEMLRIALENPEYLEALMKVENLKAELIEKQRETFGN